MTITVYTRADWVRDATALAKPNITFLSVFTTLGGIWLAPGSFGLAAIIATILGTALIVAAANTLNCYIERDSDRFMARTKNRPLPAGRMNPRHALWLGTGLAALSIPILTFVINPVTGLLGAIALVSYVWIYTPMKQISPLALWVGAVPGAMPPLLGWTAVTGRIEWPGVVLFGIMFLWQMPHFIAISMYREQEYNQAGIKTVPGVHGVAVAKK
jgi:protoheme IX farnesyltransferase